MYPSFFKKFTNKNKILFVFLIGNILLMSLIKIPLPYLSKIIIDDILIGKEYNLIRYTIIFFVIIVFFQLCLGFINSLLQSTFFQLFLYDLRKRIFKNSIGSIEEQTNHIQTLMISDSEQLTNNLSTIISIFYNNFFITIGYLSMLLILNIKLTIIALSFIPIYIIWILHTGEHIKNKSIDSQNNKTNLIMLVQKFLENTIALNSYNFQTPAEASFDITNKNNKETNKKLIKMQLNINIITNTIIALATFTPFFTGIFLVKNNEITIGELIAFNGYLANMYPLITSLISLSVLIKTNSAYEKRILNSITNIQKNSEIALDPTSSPIIKISGYVLNDSKNNELIKINNFTIPNNEQSVIQLNGFNGVGKSLFLKSLVGIYSNYSGKIMLFEQDLKFLSFDTITKFIIYVDSSQKTVFKTPNEELSHMSNNKKLINQIFSLLSLENKKNSIDLSMGELQLFRIARALLKHPKILILDEVLTNISNDKVEIFFKQYKNYFPDLIIILVNHNYTNKQFITKEFSIINNKLEEN